VGRAGPERLRLLRRNIGFLFQSGALMNWLDVYDNVALPLREAQELPEREVRGRVEEALNLVRLWPDRRKIPSELSGGMRKRVGLARALVTRPPLILYDEPTTGLDPAMAAQIVQLIRDLQKRLGVTSVVVTHDLECAAEVADRIGVLMGGRLEAEGDRRLLESQEPAILEFLGRGPAPGTAT
jgi:phospholipid/cholesterol/gamma-HCH transport system ATP-binding protein